MNAWYGATSPLGVVDDLTYEYGETASDGGMSEIVRTDDKLGRLKTDEQSRCQRLLTVS